MDRFEKSLTILLEMLEILGEPLKFNSIPDLHIEIVNCYMAMLNLKKARKYAKEAYELNKIKSGMDRKFFKCLYPDFQYLLD